MLLFIFVIIALSALIELDNVYAGQFMLARPSVAGLILGLVFGDFTLAVQLGIFYELLYLDNMPMGGVIPPSAVISVATAFIFAHFTKIDVSFAFILGIASGILYSHIEMHFRNVRSSWTKRIESELETNPRAVSKWVAKGIGQQFLAGFIFMVLYVGVVFSFAEDLWFVMPAFVVSALDLAYFSVPWIGLGFLVKNLKPKKA